MTENVSPRPRVRLGKLALELASGPNGEVNSDNLELGIKTLMDKKTDGSGSKLDAPTKALFAQMVDGQSVIMTMILALSAKSPNEVRTALETIVKRQTELGLDRVKETQIMEPNTMEGFFEKIKTRMDAQGVKVHSGRVSEKGEER